MSRPSTQSTVSSDTCSHCSGFTLVELLVVMAIVAALIAVLLPALNRARESAKQIACLSNVRQIGLLALMYANDQNDYFPMGRRDYPPPVGYQLMHQELQSAHLLPLNCQRTPNSVLTCPASHVRQALNDYCTYSWNTYMGNDVGSFPAIKRKQVKRPATILTTICGVQRLNQTGVVGYVLIWYVADWTYVKNQKNQLQGPDVHRGGTNAVFADGHASFLQWSDENFTANPTSNQSTRQNNYWKMIISNTPPFFP